MKKALILGGSGFIGSHIARNLLKKGFQVHTTGYTQELDLKNANHIHYKICLSDQKKINKILPKSYDYVINASGYIDHSDFLSGGKEVFDSHFTQIRNIIDHLNTSKLKRFINLGSSDEYGNQNIEVGEDQTAKPFSPYSLGKYFLNTLLQFLHKHHNFPFTSYRLFLVYGPNQKTDRFLPYVINSCLKGETFAVSSGEQIRDFLFIDDLTEIICTNLDNDDANGQIVNIGSGKKISIKETIALINSIIGNGKPEFGKVPYRSGESMYLVPDLSKSRKILKLTKTTQFYDGLVKTINFYKTNAK